MARYSKNSAEKQAKVSDETQHEAMKIAKGSQRPGQSKAQTKLIAQGIQKGIDQYKKQHKARSRALNKQLKNTAKAQDSISETTGLAKRDTRQHWLPWILLVVSWGLFTVYLIRW